MPHPQAHRKTRWAASRAVVTKRWIQRAAKETLTLGLLLMTQLSLVVVLSVVI